MNRLEKIESEFYEAYRPLFQNKKIVLGVSASIAAYRAIELTRMLQKLGAEVRVVLTENAKKFVTPYTFEVLTKKQTVSDSIEHIEMARWADLFLVAPATANTVSKLARGEASDLLSTEILATRARVILAPAMNPMMLSHPLTIRNLKRLSRIGYHILPTQEGLHQCGEWGSGRLLPNSRIIEEIAPFLSLPTHGKRCLISMGPTRSFLDPIRYLSNQSSGKMGAAIAFEAIRRGYQVEIVTGPTETLLPSSAMIKRVETTDQMFQALQQRFHESDLYISTAAVLDYQFSKTFEQKQKKGADFSPDFIDSIDILKTLGQSKKDHQKIIGFAAETADFVKNAKIKLKKKNCDAVFVNPVSTKNSPFGSDQNEGWWVTEKKSEALPTSGKILLAQKIFDRIEKL